MSKAVVKKVKNSSVSGAVNSKTVKVIDDAQGGIVLDVPSLLEDAVATLPAKEELAEELRPIVAKALVEATEDNFGGAEIIADAQATGAFDCSGSIYQPGEIYYDRLGACNPPEVTIGGKVIPVEKLEPGDKRHPGDWIFHLSATSNNRNARMSDNEITDVKKGGVYFFTHKGVNVAITNGSQLILDDLYNTHPWDYEPDPEQATLSIVGSRITAKSMLIRGKAQVFNSSLTVEREIVIDSSTLTGFNTYTKDLYVEDTGVNDSNICAEDTVRLIGVQGTRYTVAGGTYTTLERVRNYRGEFELRIISTHGKSPVDIKITNIDLAPFTYCSYGIDKIITDLIKETKWGRPTIEIKRRIDYGYFSGLDATPFVRIGDDSILVDNHLFQATEFIRTSRPERMDDEEDMMPKYKRGIGGISSMTGKVYIGSDMFRRIERVITRLPANEYTPVGKNGEQLVNTLADQIRSRVNLYVEAQLFD